MPTMTSHIEQHGDVHLLQRENHNDMPQRYRVTPVPHKNSAIFIHHQPFILSSSLDTGFKSHDASLVAMQSNEVITSKVGITSTAKLEPALALVLGFAVVFVALMVVMGFAWVKYKPTRTPKDDADDGRSVGSESDIEENGNYDAEAYKGINTTSDFKQKSTSATEATPRGGASFSESPDSAKLTADLPSKDRKAKKSQSNAKGSGAGGKSPRPSTGEGKGKGKNRGKSQQGKGDWKDGGKWGQSEYYFEPSENWYSYGSMM